MFEGVGIKWQELVPNNKTSLIYYEELMYDQYFKLCTFIHYEIMSSEVLSDELFLFEVEN